MKESKRFTVQQIDYDKMGIYSVVTGKQIGVYYINNCATYMQSANLASDIIEAFDNYMLAIEKSIRQR